VSAIDPAPTWLVKRAADVLAPVIAVIFNASLQQQQTLISASLQEGDRYATAQ